MTTEHVSVPRTVEDVRNWHLHQLRTLKEAWQPYEHHKACAAILSRATPSDDKTSAPRMVTDAHVAVAERAYMDAFNTRQNRMRAALESFATSLPVARVPDDYRKVTADAVRVIVKCADEYRSAVRDVFALREDGKPYAERDTTKDSDAMWAFQRLNDAGARLVECCARIQPALIDAAPQAGEKG